MPAPGSSEKSDRRRQVVLEAAVECFARKGFYGTTTNEIAERAAAPTPQPPELALRTARSAYNALVRDRDVLRFLMHANCAVDEPLIREAVQWCYAKQVELVRVLVGPDDEAVRQWFAAGMLENVTLALGLADIDEPWARTLGGRTETGEV